MDHGFLSIQLSQKLENINPKDSWMVFMLFDTNIYFEPNEYICTHTHIAFHSVKEFKKSSSNWEKDDRSSCIEY